MRRVVIGAALATVIGGTLVATWFSLQDPAEISAWLASFSPEPTAPSAHAPPPPRVCKAMTWGVRGQSGLTTWVGAIDQSSDAYVGDTPCTETRPLLCFQPGTRPRPEAFDFPGLIPSIRWTGGAIALIPDVPGFELRSREVADRLCAAKLGDGWRMAEFHDGGGWGLGAEGELPKDARFWVAISDQRANPWDR